MRVKGERNENASEIARTAVKTPLLEEQEPCAKLKALQIAIDEGDASGIADDDPFERVVDRLQRV